MDIRQYDKLKNAVTLYWPLQLSKYNQPYFLNYIFETETKSPKWIHLLIKIFLKVHLCYSCWELLWFNISDLDLLVSINCTWDFHGKKKTILIFKAKCYLSLETCFLLCIFKYLFIYLLLFYHYLKHCLYSPLLNKRKGLELVTFGCFLSDLCLF